VTWAYLRYPLARAREQKSTIATASSLKGPLPRSCWNGWRDSRRRQLSDSPCLAARESEGQRCLKGASCRRAQFWDPPRDAAGPAPQRKPGRGPKGFALLRRFSGEKTIAQACPTITLTVWLVSTPAWPDRLSTPRCSIGSGGCTSASCRSMAGNMSLSSPSAALSARPGAAGAGDAL